MKQIVLCLSILLVSNSLWGRTKDLNARRNKIIKIINEEISEVSRLMRQSRSKNPGFLLRMAELNLEKARLYREQENHSYLAISTKKRYKINKRKYFANSSKYFNEANKLCLKITRKFKNFSQISEVYYILGYNAKEANKPKKASKYLELANRKSKKGITKIKSQISLGEIYYNNKKYRKAIPLYEKALTKYRDKWWTKDSFNLAWCYFRVNNFKMAISKMNEIYTVSKNPKYIDLRAQVERDIGLFYATADKIESGIKFYRKIGVKFTDQLLRIAVMLNAQGKFSRANKVLVHAGNYEKNRSKLIEINIEKLNLYEKFAKYNSHHNTAKKLFADWKNTKLSTEQRERYSYHLEKMAAVLQRQVISKTYKRLRKQRLQKAHLAISYFEMLSKVLIRRDDEFQYLKGETAYAVGLYSQAYSYYKETFLISVKKNKKRFKAKSINAMLNVLSRLPRENKKYIYTFEAYIRNWPKGRKAKKIYSRLFNNYMSIKDYVSAEDVVNRFVKHNPRDISQEAMIAKIMDVNRKNNENDKIRSWISKIDAGVYFVSAKYKIKLQELLTAMQIDNVQKQLHTGNKKEALVGYLGILKDKYSTKRSKINSQYNLAALYYELGNQAESYRWAKSSIEQMSNKDVRKFSSSFITIANSLFTSLEFKKSADLSALIFKKICKLKTKKKKTVFKNGVFIYLADGRVKEAEAMLKRSKSCKISSRLHEEAEYEIMREYESLSNWKKYEFYIMKLQHSERYYSRLIEDFLHLSRIHKKFNNLSKSNRFTKIASRLFYKARKSRKIISLNTLDHYASISVKKMERTLSKITSLKLSFPEKKFQKMVGKKIALLDKLVEQGNDVLEIGSGTGIVNSYRVLNQGYTYVGTELKNFTPSGKGSNYVKGFKTQFSAISSQMFDAGSRYIKEAKRAIKKNTILSQYNFFFQSHKFPVQFFENDGVVLMDRGGK